MSSSSMQSSSISSSMMSMQSNEQKVAESKTSSTVKSTQQQNHHQATVTSNDTIVSGHKFNISNGLNRSRHVSGSVDNGVGSALKGLDTALEQIAAQQRREESHQYVTKVSSTSRQTSKRNSVTISSEDHGVTDVRVSLPASRNGSRSKITKN